MRTNLHNIKGSKVLVVGLGKSGTATCQMLVDMGAHVSVQDNRKETDFDRNFIEYLRGRGVDFYFDTLPSELGDYDMMVLSPGVSSELFFVEEAKEKGVEVIGELEIAFRVGKGHYVAITGTNGKTTTTSLVGEIFNLSGRKTYVVGNIGTAATLDANQHDADDWLITEASSFQLETIKYFKPVVSAILNITPDHLNRHHTMEAYCAAKARVFENQTADGFLIINYDDKQCFGLAKGCKARVVPFSRKEELDFGVFLRGDEIIIKTDDEEIPIFKTGELRIIGGHNVENALAAVGICYFSGISPDVIARGLKEFDGVAHRIEFCDRVDGVDYYNDSKGTNTDATITALKAFDGGIVLIAGGDGKGQEFHELAKEFNGKVKALVLLGKDGKRIGDAAEAEGFSNIHYCGDMQECVNKAHELAEKGDTVLLSPACASWDMYDNFEQRGDHFKACVRTLSR